ncbi:MAG: DUF4493 domain-containing protein [Muribaculaceae bacterium]|nr:DUF4493 domain-containing protein [Muribaculaceae bacterium]
MRHFKLGIPILGALTVATGLFGCADESHWGSSSNEKGSISLTLFTNRNITTAKPVFRSGEESRAEDPNDLNTYINVPAAADFKVKLEKTDGSYSKIWSSLIDFKEEAASSTFNTGAYTLTAFYGEKGTQDFEAPYFEASSSFTVLSNKTQEVNLEAEIKNSMVKINYTPAFKDYMSNYYSMIHTEGRTDDITYGMVETRPAFLEPNNANVTVHFTTKDKGYTSSISLGEFAPSAKTLHNITFDIVESQSGTASLNVSFDDTLEDEDINIDLTDELFTTPAPVITCEGFTNGETVNMLEGTGSDVTLKMNVKAEGKIKSAVLTVDSPNYTPSWGEEYDLCKAFEDNKVAEIRNAGIDAIGFGFTGQPTDMEGYLTLTDFGKSLPKGVHTISLTVIDQSGKVSEPAVVVLNSEEITIDMVGEPTIVYGSGQAVLTLDYNGTNPDSDISFQAVGSDGYYTSARIISCEENTSTRAFEKKRYVYTIELPVTTKSSIEIQVYHKGTKLVGEFQVPVTIPAYEIAEYDAFSKYAYLRVTTPNSTDPSVLAAVINNLVIKSNDNELNIASRDASNGIVTLSGLTPATAYTITSSITGDVWNNSDSFTTETELGIPNGDFKAHGTIFERDGLQVGGEYRVSPADYHHTSSCSRTLPADWATVNDLTAWSGSSNKNTWFIVPSSWLETETEKGYMRNVGYNHAGTTPSRSGGAFNTKYYCESSPADNQLIHAAGELFLGSYSFNGTESRSEGIAFASRPQSITFDYEYNPINGDKGYAMIKVLDASGTELGGKVLDIESGAGTETIDFNYGKFGNKVVTLVVTFKSSNQGVNAPINIPTGSKLDEGQGLGSKTINANSYHAVATGSELKIDNVTAHYGDVSGSTPAAAPKRKTSKRK